MGDDHPNDPRLRDPSGADEGELALWERFFAHESTAADDAQIDRWLADTGDGWTAASARQAILEGLAPDGDGLAVDAHAMLSRLRSRFAADVASPTVPRPARLAARARRFTIAAAWATAAAITIMAVAQPGDTATRSIRLGLRDTGLYQAGPTERLSVRFADGAEIIAAPNTTVRVSGPSERRVVYVNGEAYVDADRDTVHRLIVRAGNAFLENVGARFAIHTDSDNKEVRIAVATGVVLAGDTGAPWQSGRVLTRGTVGVISETGATRTFRPTDLDDAMVWEHGGPRLGRDGLRDELPRLDGA